MKTRLWPGKPKESAIRPLVTYLITLIVAYCSIVYELLMAQTLAAIMGNTVLRYSVTIGVYLASLGLGAILCGPGGGNPARRLGRVELLLSLVGGFSVVGMNMLSLLQHWAAAGGDAAWTWGFFGASHAIIVLIGLLSGYEVPLLIALRENDADQVEKSRGAVNVVLGVDYFGSLAGAVAFPLVLLPLLGVFSIAYVTAMLNILACLLLLAAKPFAGRSRQAVAALALGVVLSVCLIRVDAVEQFFLKRFYYSQRNNDLSTLMAPADALPRVDVRRSPYQRIHFLHRPVSGINEAVLSVYTDKLSREQDFPRGLWMYMERQYQFCSDYEEIYHEFFAHVPVQLASPPGRVLLLGAGDGLLAREMLKYPQVRELVLVDLDPVMLDLARNMPELSRMNRHALEDPRVRTVAADAFSWLRGCPGRFDAIYCDFPRPNNYDLSRLYSREFYSLVREHLAPGGYAAADLPGIADPGRYLAAFRAAGFGDMRPFAASLEPDNQALARVEEDFSTMGGLVRPPDREAARDFFYSILVPRVLDSVCQGYVFLRPVASGSGAGHGPVFTDYGLDLYVLNARRLDLSLKPRPMPGDFGPPNSVNRPTIPRTVWGGRPGIGS